MPVVWKRVPSVTYGGKAYFYVALCQNHKYTVVWNRLEESWVLTQDDKYVTNVSSSNEGIKLAERMCTNNHTY